MTSTPQKKNARSKKALTRRSGKAPKNPKVPQYIRDLNRLRTMRATAGRALHSRIKLADKIYCDPEYREKIAVSHGKTATTVSPDLLKKVIEKHLDDLIDDGWDFIMLQNILKHFPNPKIWEQQSPHALYKQIKTERDHPITKHRRCATIEMLDERDLEIQRLLGIIRRLEAENAELKTQIADSRQEVAVA